MIFRIVSCCHKSLEYLSILWIRHVAEKIHILGRWLLVGPYYNDGVCMSVKHISFLSKLSFLGKTFVIWQILSFPLQNEMQLTFFCISSFSQKIDFVLPYEQNLTFSRKNTDFVILYGQILSFSQKANTGSFLVNSNFSSEVPLLCLWMEW